MILYAIFRNTDKTSLDFPAVHLSSRKSSSRTWCRQFSIRQWSLLYRAISSAVKAWLDTRPTFCIWSVSPSPSVGFGHFLLPYFKKVSLSGVTSFPSASFSFGIRTWQLEATLHSVPYFPLQMFPGLPPFLSRSPQKYSVSPDKLPDSSFLSVVRNTLFSPLSYAEWFLSPQSHRLWPCSPVISRISSSFGIAVISFVFSGIGICAITKLVAASMAFKMYGAFLSFIFSAAANGLTRKAALINLQINVETL